AFNLCMTILLFIIVIFAFFNVPHLDFGLIFSALFGIYLLLAAYAAIGLFLSCLSRYQVVAAIATFAVFAFLNYIGSVWQKYDLVRYLTHYLAIPGRTETMVRGLVSTKAVVYYLLISGMFLTFTWLKLRGERRQISWPKTIASYASVVIVVWAIGLLTSKPGYIGYIDGTRNNTNTISKQTQDILKDYGDQPLDITTYINFLDRTFFQGRPSNRISNRQMWEQY